jgi:hypothetical protein
MSLAWLAAIERPTAAAAAIVANVPFILISNGTAAVSLPKALR